ncbi:MAG: O-antigen ligase family protein [Gaiellaceae bacterium]
MATLRTRYGAGPLIVAAALPFLFLHRHYQPSFGIGSVDADLSDVAVAVVVAAAIASWSWRRLARALPVWEGWAALALLVVLSTLWGWIHFAGYPAGTHATTAAKWLEYMLLAPALVLLVRSARDLEPAAVVLVGWSGIATVVGLLQFFGALDDLDHTPAGRRKPSFVGVHDFAALSGAALLVGLLVLARGARSRLELRIAITAVVAGGLGMVLAGPLDALIGTYLAVAALVLLVHVRDPRRLATIAGVVVAVTVGVALIRSSSLADGLKFLGIKQGTGGASTHIQSYRQRALLAYIGGRIFVDHPWLGVGWQGSSDPYAFEPYLADARRRFDQPADAFPSRRHRWGVQNAYVQSLADMGVFGLLAFLAALLVPAWAAARRGAGDARVLGVALPLLALGVWNGYGLVAGIPLAALTWLAVGVAGVAVTEERT